MVRKLIAATIVAAAVSIFAAGAHTADSAMHPPRQAVAEVCPCFSHTSCRDAAVAAGQRGWFLIPDRPNGAAVLMLHGIGATRVDMIPLSGVFLKAGYSVLVPDLRGSGKSDGAVTFGADEAHDVKSWVDWLTSQPGISRLYGFGVSLGGSVLLESLDYEKRFRAVVAESAFSDFYTVAAERTRRSMPAGFGWVTAPLIRSAFLWAKMRYGADLAASSPVQSVAHSHTPMLIIHGADDDATLPDHSRRIAAANPQLAELWVIPKARHANAWATAGKEFERRVLTFYGSH